MCRLPVWKGKTHAGFAMPSSSIMEIDNRFSNTGNVNHKRSNQQNGAFHLIKSDADVCRDAVMGRCGGGESPSASRSAGAKHASALQIEKSYLAFAETGSGQTHRKL
jgi:hypothetical protein